MASFMEGDPRYRAMGNLTPRLAEPKQTGVFLGGQRYDPNRSIAGQVNGQFLAPSEMASQPAGSVTFADGVPQSAPAFVNQLDQAQQRAQFLGSGQWTGGGPVGRSVGMASQAATDAIQQQGKEAAAMYGIRRLGSTEAEQDVTAQNAALRSGGSIQSRQRAFDKVTGDINMRNAQRQAQTMAEQQIAGDVEKARYAAEAMASKAGAQLEGKRMQAQAQLMGRIYAANAGFDAAKMAGDIRLQIAKAGSAQDAAKAALTYSAQSGLPVVDDKGKATPLGDAVKQFAMAEYGQTDQGIQQTQVAEAPGKARMDLNQDGDVTPDEQEYNTLSKALNNVRPDADPIQVDRAKARLAFLKAKLIPKQ